MSSVPIGSGSAIDVARTREFEIRVRLSRGNRATVKLRGELDLCSVDLLVAVLENHIAAGRHHIRLDMSALSFIDCTGLRAVVDAHNTLLLQGGRLDLIRVGPPAARLLRITELDTALHVETAPPAPKPTSLMSSG
jgi:stage II sporulation protein AA (anti-sigma F factor antagonist)